MCTVRTTRSQRLPRAALLVAALGCATSAPMFAWAQPAEATATSMEDVREQGVLYIRKKMFRQAKTVLDRAYAMPGGNKDFATLYYRGMAYFQLMLLEEAFRMTELAGELATEERQKRRLDELKQEMSSLFGAVVLKAAEGETNAEGRIFFETRTGIINKVKKDRFLSIRERFRTTDISLPITVYLPWGDYLANKVPFELKEGEAAPELEIFLQVDRTGDEGPGISPWVWVGVGSAVAIAAGLTTFFLMREDDIRTPPDVDISIGSMRGR